MRLTDKPYYKQPWYNSYRSMMDRCYRKDAHNYPLYGGRGIEVCEEWQDIESFAIWCEKSCYREGLTLDRIDVNGNYEPHNCRWATRKEQANNRRNTIYVTIDGITKTLSQWADFAGISRSTISGRWHDGVRGVMLLHRAEDTRFTDGFNRYDDKGHYDDLRINHGNNEVEKWELNGEKHSISEWSELTGINETTLRSRKYNGWDIEQILTTPLKLNKYAFVVTPTIIKAEGET